MEKLKLFFENNKKKPVFWTIIVAVVTGLVLIVRVFLKKKHGRNRGR